MKKKNINVITREKWLRHAVELLDTKLFNGDLDLFNKQYQVSIGRCKGKRSSETVFPYSGEDVNLDDFFPVTMQISWTLKDPIEILGNLALECIHAFFNEPRNNKRFKQLADKYYFEKPYNHYTPSTCLTDILKDIHKDLVKNYGEFPGYAVVFREKKRSKVRKTHLLCSVEIADMK